MKKILLIILVILLLVFGLIYFLSSKEGDKEKSSGTKEKEVATKEQLTRDFIQCLEKAGMIIYGSGTCPACSELVDQFGGYDKVASIYVECTEEEARCKKEMKTNYVPEVQIKSEVYSGPVNFEGFSEATKCEISN